MSKLKDKTLNKDMRTALAEFAKDNVKCPKEEAAFDAAYAKAKPLVIEAVTKRFPAADMVVMDKYGAAVPKTYVRFGGKYDDDSTFRFRTDAEAPLTPRYNHSEHFEWSKDALKALQAYVLARQAFQKARDEKLRDYQQLVVGSRTFNEVAAVWPAVEALRVKLIPVTVEQRALAVLSEEAIARIRKDNAGASATT